MYGLHREESPERGFLSFFSLPSLFSVAQPRVVFEPVSAMHGASKGALELSDHRCNFFSLFLFFLLLGTWERLALLSRKRAWESWWSSLSGSAKRVDDPFLDVVLIGPLTVPTLFEGTCDSERFFRVPRVKRIRIVLLSIF